MSMLDATKSTQVADIRDNACWDAFVAHHPAAHPLQTSAWGALKSRFEWHSQVVSLSDADGLSAGTLILFRRTLGLTLAYAPKGPLVNWQDRAQTDALLEKMVAECRRQGAAFLKIEPDIPDTPANRMLLHGHGFRPSPQTVQPQSTILLDLSGSEEAILQRMKSKWRYNIRLAERKGVTVRECGPADLHSFNQLMQMTSARDGFAVHSADYYNVAFDLLVPRYATFLLAEFAGQPLAALVVCATGKTACYLWGASSDRERNRMPNHALQWAAMRWARARGATCYDFYGIPDDVGKVAQGVRNGDGSGVASDELPLDLEAFPSHELWGVYRFKQGFGGNVVRFVGAWDLPINEWGYRVYQLGLGVRERLKAIGEIKRLEIGGSIPNLPISQALNLQKIHEAAHWRNTLSALPNPHVLQSWEWGEVKGQTEWRAERFALCEGQVVKAAFQFLWRQPTPYLPLRIAYVPKGPVVDWTNGDLVDETLAAIEGQARRCGCIFVKVDPDVREDTTTGRLVLHALERRGWRFSRDQIQFKNTAVTDLSPGETSLLDGMKSKWRYNIRLAERRGISVRQGSVADLTTFYALYAETAQRDGFLIRPFDYYHTTWQTFLTAQVDPATPVGGVLLLAEHADDPQPVAGLFLLRYGQRAWYFYGASSERQRRDMPNYLLQWEALRWALAQGCTLYDWWGAPTDIENADDPMQGVWQFKQGFGAQFQPQIGAWDYPVSPLLYRLHKQMMPRVLAWLRRRHGQQQGVTT